MNIWINIAVVAIIGILLYREILKSASKRSHQAPESKPKAGLLTFIGIGIAVSGFMYAGMSVTLIETRDLHPVIRSPQMVSIYDKGVIELNGMAIKTNLAKQGELSSLASQLTTECHGDDGCEAQKLFDFVTRIPYKTDHTSRHPKEVLETNWGDCDDKSNLYASLLNERGLEYRFVYVPHHVFVVVHVKNTQSLPFLRSKLFIGNKDFYYAETTASGSKIGEFNGEFPYRFEGIYDIQNDQEIDLEKVHFRIS